METIELLGKLLIRAIAKSAAQFEAASLTLYQETMRKAKTPRTKELLKKLADDEKKHIGHLEELLRGTSAKDGDIWATMEIAHDIPEIFAAKDLEGEKDVCEFLKSLIDFEETTEAFYRLAGQRTPIPPARRAFELLSEDEHRHAQVLRAEFDFLGCKTKPQP